jgi:hypothetical protein
LEKSIPRNAENGSADAHAEKKRPSLGNLWFMAQQNRAGVFKREGLLKLNLSTVSVGIDAERTIKINALNTEFGPTLRVDALIHEFPRILDMEEGELLCTMRG